MPDKIALYDSLFEIYTDSDERLKPVYVELHELEGDR